jgi:hypothetical protein
VTPLDVAKLRNSKDCVNLIAQYGGTTGIKVANIAALKIQRNLKKLMHKTNNTNSSLDKNVKQNNEAKKFHDNSEMKNEKRVENNEKLKKMNLMSKSEQASPKKKLIDKGAQTNLHLITHKVKAASTGSSNITNFEFDKKNNRSPSIESEKSQKSSSGVFSQKRHEPRKNEKKIKVENDEKKVKLKPIKNSLLPSTPIKNSKHAENKLLNERIYNSKPHKRYQSEKRAGEKIHINKYDRFNSQARDRDEAPSLISSNTLSFDSSISLSKSSSSSSSSLDCIPINRLNKSENVHHHHFHCHHYCHHSRKKHRNNESDNEERLKSKLLNKRSTSRLEMPENNLIQNNEETPPSGETFEETMPNGGENDEQLVKLIIKSAEPADFINQKNYHNLFDRQRLLLKSLYEIRRSRLNNRSVSFKCLKIF